MSHSSSDTAVHTTVKPTLVVRAVAGKRELATFLTLPRRLYRNIPGFVPTLDLEQADLLHPEKAAFFRHASVQYFLAWRGDAAVGRIAACVDFVARDIDPAAPGYFGALDAIDDAGVVANLLKAAQEWLHLQGMSRMRGPLTLSPNGESGLMIEGQRAPATIAMPWHPAYLANHMEAFGFESETDLLSYRIALDGSTEQAHVVPGGLTLGEGSLRNIAIKALSKSQIVAQGETLRQLYNDAWAKTWNFAPLQPYEISAMIKQLKPLLKPEHYVQIEQNGTPVAMALVVPNMPDIAGDLGGKPSIPGWIKLGLRLMRHRFSSARVVLLGVSSELQGTVLGSLMPGLAIAELFRRSHALPYKFVDLGWIRAHDEPMRRLIERLAPTPNKRYRVYERAISD